MRDRRRVGLAALLATLALGGTAAAQQQVPATMPERAKLGTQERHPTATFQEVKPHWVYILDPDSPHLIASKIYVVDGDTLKLLGMMNTGYLPNLAFAPDKSALYVAETYWSRGTRGERSDMVTFYDPKTFEATGEVSLPRGRFLVETKIPDVALTTDGRYLLSYNMDPSTSVSVVDVKDRRYVGELETAGCGMVYPTGPTSFAMLCSDGSFATVGFDLSGKGTIESGQPFFNSDEDPLFEHAAVDRPSGRGYFVSYDGWVYPVDFSGREPRVGDRWRLQGQGDEGWRPGGWELAAYHARTNRLFVQMHQGGRWTHKQAGEEIWVYDLASRRQVRRIKVDEASYSIAVTPDDSPLLFSFGDEKPALSVYDATTYEHKGSKEGIGDVPPGAVLYLPDG